MKLSAADKSTLIDFGNRLKRVLLRLKIKQKDFAEKINVTPNTVCLWVKGKRDISLTYLYRIIDYFHDSFPDFNAVLELCPDMVLNEQRNITSIQRENIISRLQSLPEDLQCEVAVKCNLSKWDEIFEDSLISAAKKILRSTR
ncbi:MAG: helix-turn-helix transcriptional regulator [Lachnospiraceae bacterium]|nr:helix-turn-helix transcriptional regulator [Lachnospiraceae bacterium]